MPVTSLTEWLNSPETQALISYLRHRKALALQAYLGGNPVDAKDQGRAMMFHELERLLLADENMVRDTFNKALKGNG